MKKLISKKFWMAAAMFVLLMVPVSVFADGLIVIHKPHPGGHPFPLEVMYHRVNVSINGQIAETSIAQSFFNPTHSRLEGYYIFPIPKGAVIKNFTMVIDGKETAAELLDADKARKIYEDIVRQMRDPALLEYSEQGLFRVRIFPIEPRSEKKVSISYTEVIDNDFGMYEYVYPLNTEKFSAKPLKDVSINVDIKNDGKLKTIYCPTHATRIVRKDAHHAIVGYEEKNSKPDVDFKLYFSTDDAELGFSLLSYKDKNEDGYFYMSLTPALEFGDKEIIEKDITFVLDVSGSMAGDKLKHAKKALTYCVDNLNDGDKFEIIKFSTEAFGLFKKTVLADDGNKAKAYDFINKLKPVGGTNIEEALLMALNEESNSNRPHMVIFITDGKPTIGETDEDKLVSRISSFNKKGMRIFTFGIGDEINTHLLDKITEQTRATRTYVLSSEEIEIKISQFYDKVQSPLLTDLKLELSNADEYQIYPKNLPDLFKGSNLVLFGRYKISGKSRILLTGKVNGEEKIFVFNRQFVSSNKNLDFIPPLWASRRIGHLLDLIRLHGESKELVDEITGLAREHGIITPYTSYLILEDEDIRTQRSELPVAHQTMRGSAAARPEISEELAKEYKNIKDKSGALSVQASEEVRNLNYADNLIETRQGEKRLGFIDDENNESNLTQQVKNVQGRAFYQNGNFWVDSKLQKSKKPKPIRIQFGSEKYFELVANNFEAGQFLSLGRNVRFMLGNDSYEIYE